MEEKIFVPIWTNKGEIIGYKRLEDVNEKIDSIKIATVVLFNKEGLMLVTKPKEQIWEDRWTGSIASVVRKDETPIEAARRTLIEYLGVYRGDLMFIEEKQQEINGRKRFICIFLAKVGDKVKINTEKLADEKWLDIEDINEGAFNPLSLIAFESVKGIL